MVDQVSRGHFFPPEKKGCAMPNKGNCSLDILLNVQQLGRGKRKKAPVYQIFMVLQYSFPENGIGGKTRPGFMLVLCLVVYLLL